MNTAASLFRQVCYDYRDSLVAGIICAGWDKKKSGQVITFLYMKCFYCKLFRFILFHLEACVSVSHLQ